MPELANTNLLSRKIQPMPVQDPYSLIKEEIERELQHVGALQAEYSSSAQHHTPEAARRLQQQFNDVSQQLQALETAVQAMVAAPAKYHLDLRMAYTRQVEVETLRFQLSDLQATCSQLQTTSSAAAAAVPAAGGPSSTTGSSSSSKRLHQQHEIELHQKVPSSSPYAANGHLGSGSSNLRRPPAAAAAAAAGTAPPLLKHSKLVRQHHGSSSGQQQQQQHSDSRPLPDAGIMPFNNGSDAWDSYESVMQQQVQEQDEALDHISLHVDRIKETGQLMHDELEEQALLLDNLQSDTDTTQLRLRGVRKKVADVLHQAKTDRQLCLILSLSLVLVVLTVLALA